MQERLKIITCISDSDVRNYLNRTGHQITEAANCEELTQLAERQAYDLIIADIILNGHSVFELYNKIKQTHSHLKLVVLAQQATLNSSLKAIQSGAMGYLMKPFDLSELESILNALQSEKHSQQNDSHVIDSDDQGLADLLEITNILFQVNDLDLAIEMILDTYAEFFGIPTVALAFPADEEEYFQIHKSKNLPEELNEKFIFSSRENIKGKQIVTDEVSRFTLDELSATGFELPVAEELNSKSVYFYPLKFHEEVVGFSVLFCSDAQQNKHQDHLLIFSRQIAPVLFSFEKTKKSGNSYESIIGKIIKDRVHEARMMLHPVSFAVFRIIYLDQFVDSLILDDAIQNFKIIFREKIEDQGDLIWLTADTALAIFPLKDLFMAESLATEIKEAISLIRVHDPQKPSFRLNYACISYPQSGESATEIIHNLWIKLFEEIYFMKS